MITDHVPAVGVPPDHATSRVAAAVPARGYVEDRRNLDPAPQLAVLQRHRPRRPKLNWADRALLAALLGVIPKAGATWNPAHPARQPGCNADHGQKNGANKTSAHQAKIAKDRG